MKPFGASGCKIMFSSLLVSSKKFFSEFRSPDSIKYILGINIIYYVSFFIVAFFEIEWPKKQLFVVTNKQLGIIISIVFSIGTYVIWSLFTFTFSKILNLHYRLSTVFMIIFSLNVISFLTLILNTIFFLFGVSYFQYAILWIDLIIKIMLNLSHLTISFILFIIA